jgi:hypothetical protein
MFRCQRAINNIDWRDRKKFHRHVTRFSWRKTMAVTLALLSSSAWCASCWQHCCNSLQLCCSFICYCSINTRPCVARSLVTQHPSCFYTASRCRVTVNDEHSFADHWTRSKSSVNLMHKKRLKVATAMQCPRTIRCCDLNMLLVIWWKYFSAHRSTESVPRGETISWTLPHIRHPSLSFFRKERTANDLFKVMKRSWWN